MSVCIYTGIYIKMCITYFWKGKGLNHWAASREGNLVAGEKSGRKIFHCIPFGVFGLLNHVNELLIKNKLYNNNDDNKRCANKPR